MLGILMELCEMISRLIVIVEAQQIELARLEANEQMLAQWRRETVHIKEKFRKIQR